MKITTHIGYAEQSLNAQAQDVAARYGFVIDNNILPRLELTPKGLMLLVDGFKPFMVDFEAVFKKAKTLGPSYALIRACKPTRGLRIIDATAGWGNDAAVLAGKGAEVLMIEKHPMMAAMLDDGLSRLGNSSMQLIHADASLYLETLTDYPDVIFLDPMHPTRQKSALVKKNMQVLQTMLGPNDDVIELIQMARARVNKRLVVKWPQRLDALVKPSQSIEGKTVRFDIYLHSNLTVHQDSGLGFVSR